MGQVCYVYRGGVTFLQIKRLTGRQAAIGRGLGAAPAGRRAPAGRGPPRTAAAAWPVAGRAARHRRRPVAARPRGRRWPAVPVPGPALPDVSEVLDEAFGERRG